VTARPIVARPANGLVGCTGGKPQGPAGAIAFPDMDEVGALIRKLPQELTEDG
jgi:hypothetical protein